MKYEILKHFAYDHLPRRLQDVSRAFHSLAASAARDAVWAAQRNRLKQYIEHGEAAKDMPWAE